MTIILQELKWLSLKTRRKVSRLTMFYKFLPLDRLEDITRSSRKSPIEKIYMSIRSSPEQSKNRINYQPVVESCTLDLFKNNLASHLIQNLNTCHPRTPIGFLLLSDATLEMEMRMFFKLWFLLTK